MISGGGPTLTEALRQRPGARFSNAHRAAGLMVRAVGATGERCAYLAYQ
ncbi:hypothetical protein [Candidatus Chloroploca sp. Khr17]|nr:hypothetical protein [Candidatus Chloroploca sp. Khr17]